MEDEAPERGLFFMVCRGILFAPAIASASDLWFKSAGAKNPFSRAQEPGSFAIGKSLGQGVPPHSSAGPPQVPREFCSRGSSSGAELLRNRTNRSDGGSPDRPSGGRVHSRGPVQVLTSSGVELLCNTETVSRDLRSRGEVVNSTPRKHRHSTKNPDGANTNLPCRDFPVRRAITLFVSRRFSAGLADVPTDTDCVGRKLPTPHRHTRARSCKDLTLDARLYSFIRMISSTTPTL